MQRVLKASAVHQILNRFGRRLDKRDVHLPPEALQRPPEKSLHQVVLTRIIFVKGRAVDHGLAAELIDGNLVIRRIGEAGKQSAVNLLERLHHP